MRLLDEVFGIGISEGAIAKLIARAQAPLAASAATIAAEVRASSVVASTAVHHLIADSRGAAVLSDFLGGTKPEVWVADRYAAQAGHAHERQLCLAHLLRDAQYAIDSGDTGFAAGFYKLLQRAVGIGRRRAKLKDTTLAQVPRRSRPPARPAARGYAQHRSRTKAHPGRTQIPWRSLSVRHPS